MWGIVLGTVWEILKRILQGIYFAGKFCGGWVDFFRGFCRGFDFVGGFLPDFVGVGNCNEL